jgi:hypothetical protein
MGLSGQSRRFYRNAVFNGLSNQLALYHTERFLAEALQTKSNFNNSPT